MEDLSLNELIENIKNDLAAKAGPLSLKQKFALFMLPDAKLDENLRNKKAIELQKFEAEFEATSIRNYRLDRDKSIAEISGQLTILESLEFCQNTEENVNLLNTLTEKLQKIYSEYSVKYISDIEAILTKISELRNPEYDDYNKLCAIFDLKNSLSKTAPIKIETELSPEQYRKFCDIEHKKQASLRTIESELLTFKYFLSNAMNDEIIFALAYVETQSLRQYAPKLLEIVHRRKYLYKDIYAALPADLQPALTNLNNEYIVGYHNEEHDLILCKLRQIIKLFLFCEQRSLCRRRSLGDLHSEKLVCHLNNLLQISRETELTNSSLYKRTYIDILTSKLGITQKAIAHVLGIAPANITQQKKKGAKKLTKGQWELAQTFNCSIDFLRGETTIPTYGKFFAKSDNPTLEEEKKYSTYLPIIALRVSNAERLLSIFEQLVKEDRYTKTMLYKQGTAPSVLKIISLLKQKVKSNTYSIDDFEFLAKLLEKL